MCSSHSHAYWTEKQELSGAPGGILLSGLKKIKSGRHIVRCQAQFGLVVHWTVAGIYMLELRDVVHDFSVNGRVPGGWSSVSVSSVI